MKTKLQNVLANLSHEEAFLIWELVSAGYENTNDYEDTGAAEKKRQEQLAMLERMMLAMDRAIQ